MDVKTSKKMSKQLFIEKEMSKATLIEKKCRSYKMSKVPRCRLLNDIDFLFFSLSLLIAQKNEIYVDNPLFELYLFNTFLKLIFITNACFFLS
jgi:hypothetical protein